MTLLYGLLISLLINFLLFIVAYTKQTDKVTDFSYTLSFAVVAIFSLIISDANLTKLLAVLMVIAWSLRLGGYLVIRIRAMGKDNRFDEMRQHFWRFAKFWFLQAITVFIVMIPTLLLLDANIQGFMYISLLGLSIFIIGLMIEAVADQQKFRFIQRSKTKRWIDVGLWKYSRHPNYLGEIMVWFGIYLFALPHLTGWSQLAGFISPLFITILLLFVSGVPMLEKKADARWGKQKAYQDYKKSTGLILPKITS